MHTHTGTNLDEAVRLLKAGQPVALPTETVYGLAANALDAEAVGRIFEAKKRPSYNPLIVHAPTAATAFELAIGIPEMAHQLAAHFWPGPLTLLLPRQPSVPDAVTAGSDWVALRVPAHPLFLEILRRLDFPLAAPSANLFGTISPSTAAHVLHSLGGRIPYIVDGGPCQVGVESTIVGFEKGLPVIYRSGGLPAEAIEAVTGIRPGFRTDAGEHPVAPGMLRSHYAPAKKLYAGPVARLLRDYGNLPAVLIVFQSRAATSLPQLVLSSQGNLEEASRNLYAALHHADGLPGTTILVETFPETGLGVALNDRLQKASGERLTASDAG